MTHRTERVDPARVQFLETMCNKRMAEKLYDGEAIDVSRCNRLANGDYILGEFVEDVDYCDRAVEHWIWSIGRLTEARTVLMEDKTYRELPVGTYLASTSAHYYSAGTDPEVKCVWLR